MAAPQGAASLHHANASTGTTSGTHCATPSYGSTAASTASA